MKILHTSDWHLGRNLYGRKRTEEFRQFLDWLATLIVNENIDLLLVAGDVFDTTTPSNHVQSIYYSFLKKVINSGCSNIIITGGNHDSPTFLEAPAEILQTMQVHVIGGCKEDISREIITISGHDNTPRLIVCAVPYLRERDIRLPNAGESVEEKAQQMVEGIKKHYNRIVAKALEKRQASGAEIPIIAMGHLFTAGGSTISGDGVRELYIGSLAHVPASIFPPEIDYLALGHLHTAQLVAGLTSRRYSGSPLPMSFAEAKKEKRVVLATTGKKPTPFKQSRAFQA